MTLSLEKDVPLARLTTIGTGGPARLLARPTTLAEVEESLRLAAERGLPALTVGLGSNVLAADDGVEAMVIRLEGDLAAVSVDGETLIAGGGATNAVCLHAARTPKQFRTRRRGPSSSSRTPESWWQS